MNPRYKRVYHYHVRKTAGTSLNAAFWALGGLDIRKVFGLSEASGNGLKFVLKDPDLIASGDYFFGSSHLPFYRIILPPETFTITILRDPAMRALSYYWHLGWAKENPLAREVEPSIDEVHAESAILRGGAGRNLLAHFSPHRAEIRSRGVRSYLMGLSPRRVIDSNAFQDRDFRNFLLRVPPRRLLAQLFTFSERLDPTEAADRILGCNAVCFTETFPKDLEKIAMALQLDLSEKQERRFGEKVGLSEQDLSLLREQLAPEYAMINRVREGLKARGDGLR